MTNRIEIRISDARPFADGMRFGDTGAYERLTGRVRFAVDPDAPAQSGVLDLDKAPRNADGLVEFTADLCILRPADPARGNRRVFFDYGNRGNKRALQFFNDAPASNDPVTATHAGNGYLFRRGYAVAWAAWEGDLLPGDGRMILDVPVATDDGAPITGLVRTELIANARGVTVFPLSGQASTRSHPAVSLDTREASLTRRRYQGDAPEPVAPEDWAFARVETGTGLDMQGGQSAIVPSATHVHLPGGFRPGWIHELVYTACDPPVLGLGHVVVRDLVSFLRHRDADDAGNPNPLGAAALVEKTYAWGRSQTGRCIRDFLHRGFNADAHGRRVFDGVLPHVSGGGLMWMNHRFANVVSPAGQQHEHHHNVADRFPFSYAESTDHLTGRSGAILERPETDPLIIHTQTATEYWQRRGSLVHTDTRGADLAQPGNVRVYLWASSQHFADPNLERPARGHCVHYCNVAQTSMLFRAMLDAMDRWASDGAEPPPSRVPTRADATLVDYREWRRGFPSVPGVQVPSAVNGLPLLDFGPQAQEGLLTREPPAVADASGYAVLVPAVDEDGNDVAGVRAPMVGAPLGTYTGWNLRARGLGHGAMHEFTGSYLPFPDSPEERRETGDPRRSVLERYGDAEGYVRAIEAAARALVADGFLLEEDVARCRERARDWSRPLHETFL